LFREPFAFDFFQAVRLLRTLAFRRACGPAARGEPLHFRSLLALSFPASAVHDLLPATALRRDPC